MRKKILKEQFKKKTAATLAGAMLMSLAVSNMPINVEASDDMPRNLPITEYMTPEDIGDEYNQLELNLNININDFGGVKRGITFGGDATEKKVWWIAGFQNGGMVVLSDVSQPIGTQQAFEEYDDSYMEESGREDSYELQLYDAESGCIYEEGDPKYVYPNHYGTSTIRQKLIDYYYVSEDFTEFEKSLIMDSDIYTYDEKNEVTYKTVDKFYLPCCAESYANNFIYAGENTKDDLDSGLELTISNWLEMPKTATDNQFWCRTPKKNEEGNQSNGSYSITANGIDHSIGSRDSSRGDNTNTFVAFKFDYSDVSFFSTVNKYNYTSVYTPRFDGTDVINSTVKVTNNNIVVDYDDNCAVNLVVQGKNGDKNWSSQYEIYGDLNISLSSIAKENSVPELNPEFLKIWIEVEKDNITYAKVPCDGNHEFENGKCKLCNINEGTITNKSYPTTQVYQKTTRQYNSDDFETNSGASVSCAWLIGDYTDPAKSYSWMDILDSNPTDIGTYTLIANADKVVGEESYTKAELRILVTIEEGTTLKGICQMPNPGGEGILLGLEPSNQDEGYSAEILILDCTLLAEEKDAWIYTSGKCGLGKDGLWTTVNLQYGYYWTLFRIYDRYGNIIDEQCYGFENI